MKKIIIGILALASISAFAEPKDCTLSLPSLNSKALIVLLKKGYVLVSPEKALLNLNRSNFKDYGRNSIGEWALDCVRLTLTQSNNTLKTSEGCDSVYNTNRIERAEIQAVKALPKCKYLKTSF